MSLHEHILVTRKSMAYNRVHFQGHTFYGLEQMHNDLHHPSQCQTEPFHCPKFSRARPFHPFPLPTCWGKNTEIFKKQLVFYEGSCYRVVVCWGEPLRREELQEQNVWVGDSRALVHPEGISRRSSFPVAGGKAPFLPAKEADVGQLANALMWGEVDLFWFLNFLSKMRIKERQGQGVLEEKVIFSKLYWATIMCPVTIFGLMEIAMNKIMPSLSWNLYILVDLRR